MKKIVTMILAAAMVLSLAACGSGSTASNTASKAESVAAEAVETAKEAANKWGISQRRVAVLCSENRIPKADKVGNMWIIPVSAEKPIDARITRYTRRKRK